jgi:hypothetical protein
MALNVSNWHGSLPAAIGDNQKTYARRELFAV